MTFDKTVFIPVAPDTAFELVTRPERLRRWGAVAARMDLRSGGDYRWTVVPGHHAAGTIQELEPGKRVVFTWGWEGMTDLPPGASTVTITLDAVEGGTNVRLVHDGLDAEQSASHAEGWNHFLDRLALLGATGDAGADEWSAAPDPVNEIISAEAALAACQRVLRTLTEGDYTRQTPCAEYNVGQLVDHLYGSIAGIARALGVEVVDTPGAAPEVRIADAAQPALEAFQTRGLEDTVDMGFAELPATMVASILNLEFLVHAWDFAAATGQKLEVSPALSDYVLGLARNTISPQMRGASFAEETVVGESAESLDRLIAFTGRQVAVR
jgi:uncharacterized protein (TIGR03086 family)